MATRLVSTCAICQAPVVPPTAFTDRQKAHIFVRDRAICCYSGASLWILDYGAHISWHVDWVDHVLPVSLGGLATLDNALCASYVANSDKSAGGGVPPILCAGVPTEHFRSLADEARERVVNDLSRFAQLHESDWYLNRALFRLLLGTLWYVDVNDGLPPRKRGDSYYAKAALNMLRAWRRAGRNVASIEERGLLPRAMSSDRQLLLDARQLVDEAGAIELMLRLVPHLTETIRQADAQERAW